MNTHNSNQNNHKWKVLVTSVAANASFSAVFQGLPTTAVLMRQDYQFTTQSIGTLLGAMGLGIAISELPWGVLTDKWGDRTVLLTGLIFTSLFLWILCVFFTPTPEYMPDFIFMIVVCSLVGIFGGSVNGASGKAVVKWFDNKQLGLAMSIRQTAVPLGAGIGALLLPQIATIFGFIGVFGFLATLCSLVAFFSWRWLYDPEKFISHEKTINKNLINNINPLMQKKIWLMVIAIGMLCMSQFAILIFLSVFFHDFANLSIFITTLSLIIIQIGSIFSRIWSGYWTDINNNRRLYLKVCSSINFFVFLLISYISITYRPNDDPTLFQTILLVSIIIISGIIISAWHGVAFTELSTMVEINRVGTVLGMGTTFAYLPLFIIPITVPYIVSKSSWSIVWIISSIFCLIAFLCFPKIKNSNA